MPVRPEDALARVVLGQCLGVRPGEAVTIETWSHALPWARALVLEARRRKAEPALVVEDEEAFFRSLALPGVRTIPGASPALAEQSDAYVYLPGPEAFPRLFGLPPAELESAVTRHGPAWWRAARRVGVRAARLAVASVTPTAATRYGVDLETWQRRVLRASLVPPGQLARAAEQVVRRLARARRVRVRHPNGTDLSVELQPGAGVVEDGRIDRADRRAGRLWTQIPTGLVAVPLGEGTADGIWETNRPAYERFQQPPVAEGARFVFRGGRLRAYAFERGGHAFASAYAQGGRGRDVPSALTFGLNPVADGTPELEEIAAGAVGLWLGDNRSLGGRHRSRFSYSSVLGAPDVELDGVRWWAGGQPVSWTRRKTTRGRRAGASRTGGADDRPARGGAAKSARR
jgi:leucyl aminopeptidase (aminopeptidase T)